MCSGSPRGGAGVPVLGLREEGWGSVSWGRGWGGGSGDRTSEFLEGKMRSFHCNWGTRRKPEGEGGGNFTTSRDKGGVGRLRGG